MTTTRKALANRANARLSTGPRTAAGKAVARMNATTHGLRSVVLVLPGERADEWDAHRAGTVAALAPVGTLETELAERAASILWRLRRVVTYETAATADGMEKAAARARGEDDPPGLLRGLPTFDALASRTRANVSKELEGARGSVDSLTRIADQLRALADLPADHRVDGDDAVELLEHAARLNPDREDDFADDEDEPDDEVLGFFSAAGVPAEWHCEPELWGGWTAAAVRAGLGAIAGAAGLTVAALVARLGREADVGVAAGRKRVARLEAELAALEGSTADAERSARSRAVLPARDVLDKLTRYESHLNKQLTQTLHLLERLQNVRAGNPVPPPVALDITVEAGGKFAPDPAD